MDDLRINFVLPSGDNIRIDLPSDMIVEDAVQQVVEEKGLHLGSNQYWSVFFKDENNGSMLEQSQTFADNGVVNGSTLRLLADGSAGGNDDLRINFVLPSGDNIRIDLPSDMIVE